MANPQYSDWSPDPVPNKRQSHSLIKCNAWADGDDNNQIDQKKTSYAWYWCFGCCILGSLVAGIGLAIVLTFWLTSKTTATETLIVVTSSLDSSSRLSTSTSIATSSNTPSTTGSPSSSSSTAASASTSASTSPSTSISTAASTASSVSISTTTTQSAYYATDDIFISCSTPLTNVTIQITVSKTVGATFYGGFTTFPTGQINQDHIDNGTDIIYTWTIISGQTINCVSSTFQIEAQYNLVGTSQPNHVDSYTTIIETSNGVTTVNSGYF
ncbi:unnamed protein product [Adineta steineri]|uniref:Uncharacterized protein n=1 Tax=Adineta steineri TaxID=433720 RepID=A0A815PS21_9BILA|nr:unnamed protein product [Adineta steineri]CAF1453104.1 unnamed protein product [Adineta steineri]